MKSLAVCVLLALLALPAVALDSFLVKDINPGPLGSDPRHLETVGDAVLFFTNLGLWRSDGTDGGTFQLTGHALEPVRATGDLYFFLNENRGLAVSDGTIGGTFDLTGPGMSIEFQGVAAFSLWVPSQGVLYFVAQDAHGFELWRSDGTVAGTRLVADLRPGTEGSTVEWLTEYKGQVWFFADDGQHGNALWRTDGTPAGTVLAVDLPALPPFTDREPLRVVGGRLLFFLPTPDGQRLWASDGTAQGTAPIRGFTALFDSMVGGNRLYFAASTPKGQELWVTDGTARGTRALTNFPNQNAFGDISIIFQPHGDLNGRFLFWADDGTHYVEPWITDGTRQGTHLLKDICPGANFCPRGYVLLVFNGRLYFTAANPARGHELWSTDGRTARFVSDICPGRCDSLPHDPFVLGGRLFFVARDGENGEEVWSTNGTAAGTVRVTDFAPPFSWAEDGFHGAVLDGKLLFGADDGVHGMELWAVTP
ncbi:MAG: hypothetical protein QOH06_1295 [Acidobacteriota bacterium]|jgi:ELWxxDGT repeat protein|nr:hypothetical protein [Acidobacteriota bacterium]